MILLYLIKSTLCLSVLILFFKLVFESKAMHQFKRFYLLAAILFSFTLPLITFTYGVEVTKDDLWIEDFSTAYNQDVIEESIIIAQPEVKKDIVPIILWFVYILGVLLFGTRYILHLLRLRQKIKAAQKIDQKEFTLALVSQSIIPHSFLRWIFISKTEYKQQEVAPEIIAHEATHVRQKHSWDILFIECMQVIFWFNPLIWITKKSIKLNHEFLADQGAMYNNPDIAIYQNLLLRYASSSHQTTLESPFNYSLIKKRIIMLSQSFNPKKIIVRVLLLIPVIGLCLLFFNNDIIAQAKANKEDSSIEGKWIDQETEANDIHIYKKNDTLWFDAGFEYKYPIYKNEVGYYLQSNNKEKENIYLKKNENFLFYGTNKSPYISLNSSKKRSLVGSWENKKEQIIYTFSLENNSIYCDITRSGQNAVRYYPILKNDLITFTIGYDWVSFRRDGENLIFTNNNIEIAELSRLSTFNLEIQIIDDDLYTINGKETNLKNLLDVARTFYPELTYKERKQVLNIHIIEPKELNVEQTKFLLQKLEEYGYLNFKISAKTYIDRSSKNNIKTNRPTNDDINKWLDKDMYGVWLDGNRIKNKELKNYEINDLAYYFESKLEKNAKNYGNHFYQVNIMTYPYWALNKPTEDIKLFIQEILDSNYVSQFIEGAKRNGKKPLVIEIKNNIIKVNNKSSSRKTFVEDINAITKNWTEDDFKNPAQSYLFKDNSDTFLNTLEQEYAKTEIAKKTRNSKLLPPAPPAAPSLETLPPPPTPPSVEDHVFKMNRLGGIFFYENKEITYKKAQKLIKNNSKLNVETPFPYSNPPKTFISRPGFTQDASYKKGDTITVTVTDTGQKAYAIIDSKNKGTVIDKKPKDAGVGEKELNTYNSLVQRVNNLANNKENNLTKEDIKLLQRIYFNMNKEQKTKNQPYPLHPQTIQDRVKQELEEIDKLHIIYTQDSIKKNK